jgi:hypothetical protein
MGVKLLIVSFIVSILLITLGIVAITTSEKLLDNFITKVFNYLVSFKTSQYVQKNYNFLKNQFRMLI